MFHFPGTLSPAHFLIVKMMTHLCLICRFDEQLECTEKRRSLQVLVRARVLTVASRGTALKRP